MNSDAMSSMGSRLARAVTFSTMLFSFPTVAQTSIPGLASDKPLRVVVTTAAGGGLDLITRPVLDRLRVQIGKTIVVDNRTGAGGMIAAQHFLATSTEDSSTIYSAGDSFILNGVFSKLPFDIRKTVVPMAQMSVQDFIAFAPPTLPVNSFRELLDFARKNPGKVNFGSAGIGTAAHLGVEIIKYRANVNMTHVPYKTQAQASIDLAAGRIQLLFSNIAGIQLVKAGKAKVIGVATRQRLPDFPDTPTLIESGVPDFTLANVFSLYMNTKAPAAMVAALNTEVIRALAAPDIKERYTALGSVVAPPLAPAELRKIFFDDLERWENAAKVANVKAEDLTD